MIWYTTHGEIDFMQHRGFAQLLEEAPITEHNICSKLFIAYYLGASILVLIFKSILPPILGNND